MKNTKKIEFKPLTPIDGNRSEAVNVRRRGDWMEVTGTPAAVCPKTTDDRFLGADRRGSRTVRFGLQGTLPSGTRICNINMS